VYVRHVGPVLPLHSRLQSYMVCYVCVCVCVCGWVRVCVYVRHVQCCLCTCHVSYLGCVCMCVCVCVCVCEREFCSILHLRWYLLCCVVFGGQKGLNFRVHKKKKSEPLQQGSF